MSIKKTLYLIIMTIILCIMTLGYAALQERIDVEVEASIDSTYRVEITRVQEETTEGDARSVSVPSYHDLTSTFNVGLTNDTDYITYTIEVTNYSTVDVILNNTEITSTNNNMEATKNGIRNGNIILAGSTKTVTIKIKLTEEISSEQIGTITVMFNFTRLKGGVGEVINEEGLPSGYKTCEYIESTGTQYIDTRFFATNNTMIKSKWEPMIRSGLNSLYGTYKSQQFITAWITDNSSDNQRFGDRVVVAPIQVHGLHEIEHSSIAFIIDGVQYNYSEQSSFASDISIFIFTVHGFNAFSKARLYYFKIYDNNALVRDFIPALDNNDVPCLYEKITGETFYNQGTGDFLYQLKE